MLAVLVVVLVLTGTVVEAVAARHQPSLRARLRVGRAAVVVAALIPLALSPRSRPAIAD